MYHRFGENKYPSTNIREEQLVSHLEYLKDQGFNLGIFRSSGSIARACGPMLAGLTYFLFGSTFAYTIGAFLLLIPFLILLKVPKPARDEPAEES